MIFLGAGASKPFGIKTLEEMSNDLVKIMRDHQYGEIVDKIFENLQKFGITPDFEAIYTIVDGLTNLRQAVKNAGPLTAYVCRDLEQLSTKLDLRELPKLFRDFLYEKCKLKPDCIDYMESTFDKLFEITKKSNAHDQRIVPGEKHIAKPSLDLDYTIVTTNYDMTIELYHRKKKQPLADGFSQTEDPLIKKMDLATYTLARQRWLVKLHGSIWQYKYENSIFKTNEDPKNITIPVKIQEKMMIYPTGEKPILKYPYYNFYNIFKMQRWNKLIAIGYSFRDEPVNIAILENLEKTPNSNLIVINPDPEQVIQNLVGSTLPEIDDRIIPVEGRFGDEDVFLKLEVALKVANKERYFKRLLDLRQETQEKKAQARMQGK